jgi:hypothetical protein
MHEIFWFALGIINNILLLCILVTLLIRGRDFKSKEEFVLTFNSLSSVLTAYKEQILDRKIAKIKKDHDLDPKSQSNSINLFREQREKLIAEAANEIFSKYINKKIIKNLDEFYTRDGLILFIITYFRGSV